MDERWMRGRGRKEGWMEGGSATGRGIEGRGRKLVISGGKWRGIMRGGEKRKNGISRRENKR